MEVLACRHAISAQSRAKILECGAVETAIGMKRAPITGGISKRKATPGKELSPDEATKRMRKRGEEDTGRTEIGELVDTSASSKYEVIHTALLRLLCNTLSTAGGSDGATSAGRWGEALVYQYLLQAYPSARVTWVNEEEEAMSPI